jgi:hypothetical protein
MSKYTAVYEMTKTWPYKNFEVALIILLNKLNHFSSLGIIVYNDETVQLTKQRVNLRQNSLRDRPLI